MFSSGCSPKDTGMGQRQIGCSYRPVRLSAGDRMFVFRILLKRWRGVNQ